jgi:hypothetical protein
LFGKGSGNVHPFESYVKYLVANNESPDNVVTKVAYDDEAESMELLFTPVRNITDAEYALVMKAQEQPEATKYTMITVGQADGVTKEPTPTAKPAVKRSDEPDDADEADDDADDEVDAAEEDTQGGDFFAKDEEPEPVSAKKTEPEPTKRAGKKKAVKGDSSPLPADIASVIDAWGDD